MSKIIYPYCIHCKKEQGKHKAVTLHCPVTSGKFPHFSKDQVFEANLKKPVELKFVIGSEDV